MTDCEAKCRVLVQVPIKSANGERAVRIASTDPSLDAGRDRVWLAAPWVLNTWCAWLFGEFWLNSDCGERPYKIYIMLHHVTATHPYALKLSRSWKGLPLSPARPCPSTGSEKWMDCGEDAHPSNLKDSQKDMSSKPGWNRFSCKGWTVWELLDQGRTSFEADLWWVWQEATLAGVIPCHYVMRGLNSHHQCVWFWVTFVRLPKLGQIWGKNYNLTLIITIIYNSITVDRRSKISNGLNSDCKTIQHNMTSLALHVDKLYAIRWSKPCEPTKYLQQDWLGPKWQIAISSLNINSGDWLDAKSLQTQYAVNTCTIQNLGLEASEPLSMLAKPASSTQELKLAKAARYSACHSWMLHSAALLWRPKLDSTCNRAFVVSMSLWVSNLRHLGGDSLPSSPIRHCDIKSYETPNETPNQSPQWEEVMRNSLEE